MSLLIVLISYQFYYMYITAVPEVAVPNVIGLDVEKSEEMIDQYQLKWLVSGSRFHPSIEEGLVIESKPPSGRIVKQDRLIRLFVSKGKGPVLVPDLVGYTKDIIEDVVIERGFDKHLHATHTHTHLDTRIWHCCSLPKLSLPVKLEF